MPTETQIPRCSLDQEPLRVDRFALNDARYLTVAFRCDAHDQTVSLTFDGEHSDYDFALSPAAPVVKIRRKLQTSILPVRRVRPFRAVEPVRLGVE